MRGTATAEQYMNAVIQSSNMKSADWAKKIDFNESAESTWSDGATAAAAFAAPDLFLNSCRSIDLPAINLSKSRVESAAGEN
jgi:hypothetical protein